MCNNTLIAQAVNPNAPNVSTTATIIPSTYLVIYGSGWLTPTDQGGSHDTGNAFKIASEARHKINQREHPDDNCILAFCPTDSEFFETIGMYTAIKRLDIYCHGFGHGLNLGGFVGKRTINGVELDSSTIDWDAATQNSGRDLRRVDLHESSYFTSTETSELTNLEADSFDASVEVYFWGCNIGGQLDSKGVHILDNGANLRDPKGTFAQKFAEQIGKGTVYALVGKGQAGGSMFKTDSNGKPYLEDGELIPANISYNYKNKNTKSLKAIDYMKKFPL